MTVKEFEKLKELILSEKFEGTSVDPITYGMERADFEAKKFQRLIDAAHEANIPCVKVRCAGWKHRMEKAQRTRIRFEKMKELVRCAPMYGP